MDHLHRPSQVPSTEEYISGLSAVEPRLSEAQRRLLVEQYQAPYRSVTAPQLAQLAGVQPWKYVNLLYGRSGHMFSEETGLFPTRGANGKYWWWSAWSDGDATPQGFVWTMRVQVAEALEKLGWVTPGETQIPEEILYEDHLVEGTTWRITVNAYERNREARRKCLEYYGSSCVVCELDLGSVYGPVAQGFIHVHHLKPLAEIGREYEVDPIADLRPICPNCHAIIHIGRRTRSIKEVKESMENSLLGEMERA